MITKDTVYPYLMYNDPVPYNEKLTLYPVTMKNVLSFQIYTRALTVRKNSRFPNKQIIKMSYLEFLMYAALTPDLSKKYDIDDMDDIGNYYSYALSLLSLVCKIPIEEIQINKTGLITINECIITPQIFEDLRRIIIFQNDIDFDPDEFINYETEKRLLKAEKDSYKKTDNTTMEDYIDSICMVLHYTEEEVKNMTIRKFWRFVKRYNLHENYTIMRTGECSGMVTFKEPIKHWMVSLDNDDKYSHLKADEKEITKKVSG